MRTPLAALLFAGTALPAVASTWTAPDSTRPAPWGGGARAPQVLIQWITPSGGPATMDPVTGNIPWSDPGNSFSGGEGGYNGGASSSNSSSSDSSSASSCGGPNSSSDACSPGSNF